MSGSTVPSNATGAESLSWRQTVATLKSSILAEIVQFVPVLQRTQQTSSKWSVAPMVKLKGPKFPSLQPLYPHIADPGRSFDTLLPFTLDLMGPYLLSSPPRPAGQRRRQTLMHRAFQCPAQDTAGSPLKAQDSDSVLTIGQNGDLLASCTYEDGEDPCLYLPDGTLEEGPSTCFTTVSPTSIPSSTATSFTSIPSATASSVALSQFSSTAWNFSAQQSTTSSPRNPVAIGSPGFIAVIVAVGVVLLMVGILLGRYFCGHRSQLDMAGAPRPSPTTAQTNDAEMQSAESQRSSHNKAGTRRPPGSPRTSEPAMAESQFLFSVFGPANSGSATYPVADSSTWHDSGVQESQFLSNSPPAAWGSQAATAPQLRRISAAPPRPVREPSSDSQPDGSTTYAGSSSANNKVQQWRSQYQP
ncbi:hypothetical protein FB451DRAFT_1192368 [Mycena latifolia]|nr:hypothetical protein FB451DRAFT_1192368 [Mycena latifolia]